MLLHSLGHRRRRSAERLPFVLLNGAAAGSGYLLELFASAFKLDRDVRISPGPSEILKQQGGTICSSHLTLTEYPAAHPWESYRSIFEGERAQEASRLIFLHRDLRDALVTMHRYFVKHRKFGGSIIDFMQGGGEWPPLNLWAEDLRYFHAFPSSHVVSYEQLAAAPAERLTDLIRFMGFPLCDDCVARAASTVVRTGKIGQWRDHFDDEVESTFKALAGNIVSAMGFERDEDWTWRESAD